MTSKDPTPWKMFAIGCLALGVGAGCVPVTFGNGKKATATKEVPLFTQLDVGGVIELTARKGALSALTINGDENLIGLYEVLVVDGTLQIRLERNAVIQPSSTLTATITVPRLETVHASGGTKVIADGLESEAGVDLVASGSSTIVTGAITAPNVHLEATGSSDIQARGTAPSVRVEVSGASHVAASELAAEVLDVHVSGGSTLKARASKEARGDASGASEVVVEGAPQVRQISSSGATSVRFP